jgi:hypothetical protein
MVMTSDRLQDMIKRGMTEQKAPLNQPGTMIPSTQATGN